MDVPSAASRHNSGFRFSAAVFVARVRWAGAGTISAAIISSGGDPAKA